MTSLTLATHRVADVSLSHLLPDDRELALGLKAPDSERAGESGVLIYLGDIEDMGAFRALGFSEHFVAILEAAGKQDCSYIRFDVFGHFVAGAPTFA